MTSAQSPADVEDVEAPPPPALEARKLRVQSAEAELSLIAHPGTLAIWQGGDDRGTAELGLALAGRFRPSAGTVLLLDREADRAELQRAVVVARVLDAVEPEPRLRAGEYLATCAALHGTRHNRLGAEQALADVGFPVGRVAEQVEELSPDDQVRLCVAGALLSRPVAVVAARIDRGVDEDAWPGLLADLDAAAALTGVAIVASAARRVEREESE
jgi:predicted ABC-type transport system involved in lysophospholipase L1 biosynthesis ATPase subunit